MTLESNLKMPMTAATDLTLQIDAMNRVLAGVTRECPACKGAKNVEDDACPRCLSAQTGLGTGRIARFPGFRQYCDFCGGDETSPCEDCDDKHYLVRAGGLHDALARLPVLDALDVLRTFSQWVWLMDDAPMPSAPEILAKSLELVIKVAGLEVPDA